MQPRYPSGDLHYRYNKTGSRAAEADAANRREAGWLTLVVMGSYKGCMEGQPGKDEELFMRQ